MSKSEIDNQIEFDTKSQISRQMEILRYCISREEKAIDNISIKKRLNVKNL
jgi:hypothetical protein